jgi:hypothetical protein
VRTLAGPVSEPAPVESLWIVATKDSSPLAGSRWKQASDCEVVPQA